MFWGEHASVQRLCPVVDGDLQGSNFAHPPIGVLVTTVKNAYIGHQHWLASRSEHGLHEGLARERLTVHRLPKWAALVLVPILDLARLEIDCREVEFDG